MRVMGEVQTGAPDHQYNIPVANPSTLLDDLLGEGVQAQEVKVLTDQPVFSGSVQGPVKGALYVA